jgi:hypothetical protein
MPLAVSQDKTALAVMRLDPPSPMQIPPGTNGATGGKVTETKSTKIEAGESAARDGIRTLIRDHRLDEAYRVVMTLLEQRIAAGDSELGAASLLLQHYDIILSRQPPLSHIGALPLRPSDRLYACFDQFIDLIRQQQSQVSELQAIIAELI